MICAEQTQFLGLRRKNLIERLFVGFEQVVKTCRAAQRVESSSSPGANERSQDPATAGSMMPLVAKPKHKLI